MSAYDDAYDYALDEGLCSSAAADYAYDVWRGCAPPPVSRPSAAAVEEALEYGLDPPPVRRVSSDWLDHEYGGSCR